MLLHVWQVVVLSVLALSLSLAGVAAELDVKPLTEAELSAQEIQARVAVIYQEQNSVATNKATGQLATAVAQFYEQRQYQLVWSDPDLFQQLLVALESLRLDGLEPEDYHLAHLREHQTLLADAAPASIAGRAYMDMLATDAYLRALYHLFNGKVDAAGLDPQWNFEVQDMAPAAIATLMAEGVSQGRIADVFNQMRPDHPIYRSLKAGLARYRGFAAQGGWPALPVGPALKPGAVDPQIAILRKRLSVTGEYVDPAVQPTINVAEQNQSSSSSSSPTVADLASIGLEKVGLPDMAQSSSNANEVQLTSGISSSVAAEPVSEVFDKELVEALKRFQRAQYLEADGVVGTSTRVALNVSVQSRIDQIRVNLDRARWLLHNIPAELLLVDVAGFKITYFKASQPIWRSRVQVGMAYRTSPIFKSEVNYITLNPTWTVPPTILRKDILPKLRKDLGYLKKNRIRVLDSQGAELNPETIDWYRPGNILLRQDAGPGAALGRAVIRFPNDYAVYLHDTPHQELFNKSQRAFSSGCIRVEKALELVTLLLSETPNWDSAAIDKALATGETRNVSLAKRVPILLAYWTVDAISDEFIAFKPDIYARDPQVLAALNKRD